MDLKIKKIAGSIVLLSSVVGLFSVFAAGTFNTDLQPIGYVGQPTVSSPIVSTGSEKMYAIDYNAFNWSGDLHSYSLTTTGAISNVDDWTGGAAAQINQQDFDLGRKIVTWNGSAGIPFRWAGTATLTAAQKSALDPNAVAASATSSDILNYIRGDISKQANQTTPGPYRSRTNVLGDIIHSTPVYWNDGTNKTVFVGANDGMLHAINAGDGTERFAFIPAVLIPKLSALTVTPYVHKYFVDGRLDIRKFGTQTILAGALGAGGRGLFALDITNAAATSETDAAAKVLWEITNTTTGFANLGYTYGAPTLLTLPDGTDALAVGNGYNNTSVTNGTGNGHAALFLINAKTGELIREFDTGSGSTTSPNGLSSPSFLDTDGDGKKDVAYAGDIDGNLWKFNLTSPFTITKLHATTPAQAITMAPGMKSHPNGGTMVTFVTGRMLTDADKTDTATHYAYGIWDGAPSTNSTLFSQALTEYSYTGVTPAIRVRTASSTIANTTPDWNIHKGWKTALPIGGERIVGDGALISNSVFVFMSTNPTVSPTALPPGENWWMQLNALTGGDSNSILFDLNKDGKYTAADQAPGSLNPVGRHMGGGVRSQLIQLSSTGYDVYQSNYDKNGVPAPTTTTTTTTSTTAGRGVSNGHFDFDVYCKTNCKDGLNATAGVKYVGTDTKNYFYTHVHEYDDIYDVTGVDMLNPSQALQKLSRVKVNSTTTTSSVATSTTGPTNVDTPNPHTITSATVHFTNQTVDPNTLPAGTNTVTTTPIAVAGFPATTTSGTSTTVTTKTEFTTTKTTETYSNRVRTGPSGARIYEYDKTTKVETWKTTTTSTVTTTPTTTTTTSLVALPATTGFKVLVANQAYSPAAKVSIGGGAFVNVYGYQVANNLAVADIPTYTLANIGTLKFNLPLDAFDVHDWGTGISRAGLHPTKAACVYSNPVDGPSGEWRNGALTFQIVDASITQSDLQLNVAGQPLLGYRLKPTSMDAKLIAEYTTFWHHPNDLCMGNSGWKRNPAQDPINDATPATPASGSTDPKSGSFGVNPVIDPSTNSTTTVNTTTNPDGTSTTTTVVTTTVTNADGSTSTTTATTKSTTSSATDSNSGIDTGGAVNTAGGINSDGSDTKTKAATLGRINWRELSR